MNVLIEATLRSIPVLALAWIATALLSRASADVRSWIWRTALTASVLFLIPVPVPEPVRVSITSLADKATVSTGIAGSVPVLSALWITGFALLLIRMVVRLVALVRITRLASTFDSPNVRMSASIMTPITWGVLRPVILLPTYMQDCPADRYAATILHETAHIERQDWLWQTFAQFLTAVFWFHPLIWLASARVRWEAEQAADDRVLAEGTDAGGYAQQLLEIARYVSQPPPNAAVAMIGRPAALETRVEAILDSSRCRSGAGLRSRIAVALAAAGLLFFLIACQEERIYKVAELQTPPKVVSKVEPIYTDHARKAHIQGPVYLSLLIDPQGSPKNIRVTRTLDKGLDREAIVAIEKWHFSPGIKDGKPVLAAAIIQVNYRLR
jgi:TonB family protein